MATDWKKIIDNLPNEIPDAAKTEAKNFIEQLLTNTDDFAKRQGQKITLYLSEYASGELTADDLKECIKDVALVTDSYAQMQSVATKQKLKAVALGVSSVLLKEVLEPLQK